jgi:hypothetical protein
MPRRGAVTREYLALHKRVRRARGKAREHSCEHCGGQAAHWATIHGRDGLDIDADYMPLCVKCHVAYDGLGFTAGREVSAGNRAAVADANRRRTGEKRSPETREKMRLAALARWERRGGEAHASH